MNDRINSEIKNKVNEVKNSITGSGAYVLNDNDLSSKPPREIVKYLDEYIIGQQDAKKSVAIALRNRYRRLKLHPKIQEEVTPKNILMIGSTGVGKTEIARRMARLMGLPFVKVEASRYTQVGYVGKDVESMVRDLVSASINLVQNFYQERSEDAIQEYIVQKIARKFMPAIPSSVSETTKKEYEIGFAKMIKLIRNGDFDNKKITIEIKKTFDFKNDNVPSDISRMQDAFMGMMSNKSEVKEDITVQKAKELLKPEAREFVLDMDSIYQEGLKLAETSGIIFIDEIDKVAVNGGVSGKSQDPSKEGVQRDLLPIIEGSSINTRYGHIKTDHILFIAAGSFHFSKPSDLIPELQGRFPLRVELQNLDEETLYLILTKTKNSILLQYKALLEVEDVELEFDDKAIRLISSLSHSANEKTEDIGARRLHTTIEKVIEDINYCAEDYKGQKVIITEELVEEKLGKLMKNEDFSKFIL